MYVAEYCGKARIEKLRDEAKQERLIRAFVQQKPKSTSTFVFKIRAFLKHRFHSHLSKV